MAAIQWWLSVVLLCLLAAQGAQGSAPGGLKAEPIMQNISLRPTTPYGIASALTRTNFSELDQESVDKDSNSSAQNEDPPKKRGLVSLPPLPCDHEADCLKYDDPFLICRGGQCTCQPPYCWVYYYEVLSAWSARNVFSCGTCGVLGSWCNDSFTCNYPGQCWSDGFCHCPRGENKDDICLTTDTSWTYKMVGIGMGIVVLFGAILIAYNCYREQPWRHPQSCWYSCCNKGSSKTIQRGSNEKTPAYTIQSHYASQNSILFSASEGRGESQPSALAGAVPRHNVRGRSRRSSEGSSEDEGNTSVSSVATTATLVSDSDYPGANSSLPQSIASFPAPLRTAVSSGNNEEVARMPVSTEQVNRQQTVPEARSDCNGSSSSGVSSNCNHERCTLCLPKGPSTRPPTRGNSNASNITSLPHFSNKQQQQGNIIDITTL